MATLTRVSVCTLCTLQERARWHISICARACERKICLRLRRQACGPKVQRCQDTIRRGAALQAVRMCNFVFLAAAAADRLLGNMASSTINIICGADAMLTSEACQIAGTTLSSLVLLNCTK
jgi:hypothetical protein